MWSAWFCWGSGSPDWFVAFRSTDLFFTRASRISMGLKVRPDCWPIRNRNTMVIGPAVGTVSSVGRYQIQLENKISVCRKLVSRWKQEVWNVLVGSWFQGTQWTRTSSWHGDPNQYWLETSLWTSGNLSTLPPDDGTSVSKWSGEFIFIWKQDFGSMSNSPVLVLINPEKTFLAHF